MAIIAQKIHPFVACRLRTAAEQKQEQHAIRVMAVVGEAKALGIYITILQLAVPCSTTYEAQAV